jgi:pimeloyl-ACP methyl ester carboxylesterase
VIKQIAVGETHLRYLDQGQGRSVVFVHGGVSDHRGWENQREAVAKRYRFIAIDQRYFGPAPWSDEGVQFSPVTHVADLAAFIRVLDLERVFLVGQSYGAVVALATTVQHPDLVRGLFINEPPLPSILTDPTDQQVVAEERKGLATVSATAQAGNPADATSLFIDWVQGQPGAFDALSPVEKTVHLENARTLPLQLRAAAAPLTCTQLGQVSVPVTITHGASTRPFFRVIAQAAHRCMPGSQCIPVVGAQHGAPRQAVTPFNEALLAFLARS